MGQPSTRGQARIFRRNAVVSVQDEVASDWLFPQGLTGALDTAIQQRDARDLSTLQQVARQHGSVWAVIERALAVRPDLQPRLIGAAGVHLVDASPSQWARVAVAVAGNAAEVAAEAGLVVEFDVEGPVVSLPNSRYWVRLPDSSGPVNVQIEGAEVVLRVADLEITFVPRLRGEVGLVPVAASEHVHALPDLGDFVLDVGGISAPISLPPKFELMLRPPTGEEAERLRQSLAVLAHTNSTLHEEMRAFSVRISLLEYDQHRLSLTAERLPDLVYLNLPDPLEAVDLLVHEYHHLKLDLLQQTTPLLEDGTTKVVAPWRPELRTAEGVLHGAYVFANVARAFDPIMAMGRPSLRGRRRQAVWRVAVLRAVELLRASDAGVTNAGEQLLDGMEQWAKDWRAEYADRAHDEIRWAAAQVERHVQDVLADRRPEPLYMTGVLDARDELATKG